jgi:hypothetical protein
LFHNKKDQFQHGTHANINTIDFRAKGGLTDKSIQIGELEMAARKPKQEFGGSEIFRPIVARGVQTGVG